LTKIEGLTGDSTVISTLLPLVLPLSPVCSFIRFLNNQPRGVRESPPGPGSFRGSIFVLSVDEVLDVEALAVEVDEEDEDDDGDILDSGDFPGFLGRGAAITLSVTGGGGTGARLASLRTGEEDTLWNN
jgi:hypothetical protein